MRMSGCFASFVGWVSMVSVVSATLPSQHMKTVHINNGTTIQVEAGVLQVPESRIKATGRSIGIPWYRLKSTAAHPAAPIFMLAGGPGASGLDHLSLTEEWKMVEFYRSIADVVVFDQRGAVHSTPVMTCPQAAHYPDDQPLEWSRVSHMWRKMLVACRDRWQLQGIDLTAYNTVESAADVNDLRKALGYRRMTLIGGSYGSHLALQVMRLYPGTVARAMLYGIEGPNQTWDDPNGVLAALERIAHWTQMHAGQLGLQIPKEGLLGAWSRILQRLQAHPQRVTVKRDGKPIQVVVDADLVRLMIRHKAGSHDHPKVWPRMILAMDHGDYSMAANAALGYRNLELADPMHWSMDCASGVNPTRRQRYWHAAAVKLLGHINREYAMLCGVWPARDLGKTYRANVVSSIPTLIFQGTWDVSTPFENAREVVATLANGQLVKVVGGNHGTLYNVFDHWPPARHLLRAFLSGQRVQAPVEVLMPWTTSPHS